MIISDSKFFLHKLSLALTIKIKILTAHCLTGHQEHVLTTQFIIYY